MNGKVEHEHKIEPTDAERAAAILALFKEKKQTPAFAEFALALESSASPAPIDRNSGEALARLVRGPDPLAEMSGLRDGKSNVGF